MKNKNGLKPCPFCAKQPDYVYFPKDIPAYQAKIWTVVCKCGAESPSDSKSRVGASYKWNRRRYKN